MSETPERGMDEKETIREAANQLRMRIDHDGPCECHQHTLIERLSAIASTPPVPVAPEGAVAWEDKQRLDAFISGLGLHLHMSGGQGTPEAWVELGQLARRVLLTSRFHPAPPDKEWTPDQPLRVDATRDQIADRMQHLHTHAKSLAEATAPWYAMAMVVEVQNAYAALAPLPPSDAPSGEMKAPKRAPTQTPRTQAEAVALLNDELCDVWDCGHASCDAMRHVRAFLLDPASPPPDAGRWYGKPEAKAEAVERVKGYAQELRDRGDFWGESMLLGLLGTADAGPALGDAPNQARDDIGVDDGAVDGYAVSVNRTADAGRRGEVAQRITEYLSLGGAFNPELMDHAKVRDLLIDCRAALCLSAPAAPQRAEVEAEKAIAEVWHHAFRRLTDSCVEHFGHLPGDYDAILADAHAADKMRGKAFDGEVFKWMFDTNAKINAAIAATVPAVASTSENIARNYVPQGERVACGDALMVLGFRDRVALVEAGRVMRDDFDTDVLRALCGEAAQCTAEVGNDAARELTVRLNQAWRGEDPVGVPAHEPAEATTYREALVRVMAHTGRADFGGHTRDIVLANDLLDSIARIARAALSVGVPAHGAGADTPARYGCHRCGKLFTSSELTTIGDADVCAKCVPFDGAHGAGETK